MMNKYKNINEIIVRLVIKRGGRVLLCKNKFTEGYFLPGGHVEFGDSFQQTIFKEMKEELGWSEKELVNISFVGYLENSYLHKIDGDTHHEVNMIFKAEVNKNAVVESQEDHIDFEWVEIEKLSEIPIKPSAIVKYIV